MRRLILIGSHLGYPMDTTPLGGGAMVAMNLARAWAQNGEFEITALGAGPQPPAPGVEYVRLAQASGDAAPELTRLSELQYARFCRIFESEATRWLLSRTSEFPPESTAVVINDISEAPDFEALWRAGYRPISLWHVDVADYFCRIYLKEVVSTQTAIGLHEKLVRWGAAGAVPEVLRLVFEKQRRAVLRSSRMIFPSTAMAEVVRRAYSGFFASQEDFRNKALVIPWGAWDKSAPAPRAGAAAGQNLRELYQIGPRSAALMTLSRLAPEKGIHLLLEALAVLETREDFSDKDVCLFICGAPAFMKGRAYSGRLRAAAKKLKKTRVFFPGYLGPAEKKEFFSLTRLFVSPSVHESYGLNAVEAMAAGLPVLALDHYGSRDWPQEGFARVVSPNGTGPVGALADGLRDMLGDEDGLRDMGRKAARYASARPFSKAAQEVSAAAFAALAGKTAAPVFEVK